MDKRFWFCIFSCLFMVFAAGFVPAQVDDEELRKGQERVIFINYEGPHVRIETLEQIRNIGSGLGDLIAGGGTRAGGAGRYFIIHSISAPEGDKLDADIMGLGVDAGVDHIRNLRLIIRGYLERAYAYSSSDAALLAEYITIYNAVFRGSWDYFNTRYKTPVLGYLTPEKAGLSIRFDEWPGRTLMLIPLAFGRSGSLSAVDTSALSNREVIDQMRQEEDQGLDSRKDMVDLKEREAEEAEQSAALQREAIQEEERRIQEEQEALRREREAISQAREEARGPEQEAALAEREEAAGRREEALAQREEELEQQRAEAERTEEFAGQKAAEARQEREEIARDQQAVIAREDAQTQAAPSIVAVKMSGADTGLGSFVRINMGNGTEIRTSALNTVSVRSVQLVDGRIFAIAGENRNNGAVRLVEVNPDTLEMKAQGNDDIHPSSLLWVNGTNLYAISAADGKFYLARFNTGLERQARSIAAVHAQASILFEGDMLLTQRDDGSALILNPSDLTELGSRP